ncbi:ABC transporter permease subunit [Ralstonia solanacearum]|uniref:ABC transporter permease subunit n=1 Tax=Ralstonia solanacearum TaxID=305 RepID=UPI000F6219B5|nr:ABC transporter permease subunit [Ralstonia solanacearum]
MLDLIDIVRDNWLLLLVGQYPNGPLGGIACTLILSVLGIGLAFPLSVLLALARLSPWRPLNASVTALVYVVRGVPLLMWILWVYFLVPLLIGNNVSGFTTMVCTLVIYEGVYLSEVVRAEINNALLSKPFQIFFMLAVIYFVVCWSLTRAARALEHRIAAKRVGKRRGPAPDVSEPLPVEP